VFDVDGGGDIDKEEFIGGCKRLGMDGSDLSVGAIFELIDVDGGNTLDFEEFETAAKGHFVMIFCFSGFTCKHIFWVKI
jgi:Ca2+-binding EF-hand superfamily protein